MWPAVVPTLLLLGSTGNLALTVNELLKRSHQEQHCETLLLLRHSRQLPCSQMEQVAAAATWPVLRFSSEANFYLKSSQSTEMLALICLTSDVKMDLALWQALANNLYNMRHARLLLLLQHATVQQLRALANTARQLHFPHVVLLQLGTGNAYQLQPYAKEHWLQLQPNSSPIFARQYNYHGLTARTLPDQVSPRSLGYRDRKTGELRMTGFVAKLMQEFARVHTAEVYQIVCSWNMLVVLLGSYCVFALLDTCFGWLLMQQQVDWTNLVFNERMISGIIGQPCKLYAHATNSGRLAHAQLFLLGLIFSTLFAAHLKTLLTKRPMERMVTTFEELRDSHLSIHFTEGEHFYVNMMDVGTPIDIIRSKITFLQTNLFYKERKSMNKSKAFSMTSTEWQIIKEQQNLFQRPVLCFQPGLIFRYKILASVPLQANSIFAEPLEELMFRVHDTGLLLHWKKPSLGELIALGEISGKDPYPYVPFYDFKVGDLFWVWLGWAWALCLAFVVFLCELIVYRMKKYFNN
ncbi:uncharacterized protein Ir67a [Drosophila virilis]|uniref:Ionotropic glutamate receptor C-terminal domain-containing protein n=1 Tax=Drosophila virilis TaxID=7244 RepID=B4LI60_DROVI|nr:uncharacterized protein LOC6623506 [Drosophila virilis]EDW69627.1 uncharacterized protein Dvir_GJ13350 [Drosophila virilis]